MNSTDEIIELKEKIKKMEKYIMELEDHLKKYTNNNRHLKYYENNKEVVKERTKNYVEKLKTENPEKLKEWRRNYYLKRKEKLVNENTAI
jgi:GTP1/Obg family GTP-binding protein